MRENSPISTLNQTPSLVYEEQAGEGFNGRSATLVDAGDKVKMHTELPLVRWPITGCNGSILMTPFPVVDSLHVTESSTHTQRRLIRSLSQQMRERARWLAASAESFARDIAAIKHAHEARETEAQVVLSKALRNIEVEYKTKTAKATPKHIAKREKAAKAREAEIAAFISQTNGVEASARETIEEKAWLAETVFESTNKKIKHEFEVFRGGHDAKVRDLHEAAKGAIESLRKAGRKQSAERLEAVIAETRKLQDRAPVTQTQDHQSEAGSNTQTVVSEDETFTDSAAALTEEHTRTMALVGRLKARLHPRFLSAGFIIGGVLLCAAGGGVGAFLLRGTNANTGELPQLIGLGCGIGAGLALAGTLGARFAMRFQVPAITSALETSLSRGLRAAFAVFAQATLKRDEAMAAATKRKTKEIAQAAEFKRTTSEQLKQRREVEEPALAQKHKSILDELEHSIAAEIDAIEYTRSTSTVSAKQTYANVCLESQARMERELREREATFARERDEASVIWKAFLDQSGQAARRERERALSVCPPWEDPMWTPDERGEVSLPARGAVPGAVAIGRYFVGLQTLLNGGNLPGDDAAVGQDTIFAGRGVELPLMLDFEDLGSLLISHDAQSRGAAITALNNVMLRLLTSFPPSKARFTIIDPVGLGESFAGFMHLSDIDEQLINDKVWTDPKHIEQRLSELTEHMETVIQKYLRNEFATIQEYNAQAGEVAEPYRFLVIADFPASITEPAAKRLASIISSGPRCGVFTLIAHDVRAKLQTWLPLGELQKSSLFLRWDSSAGRFVRQDEDLRPWPIELESPPDEARTTAVLKCMGMQSKELGKVQVPFDIVAPRTPEEIWSLSSASSLRIPLGRSGATKLQYMTLGHGTAQHALIAGRTGSGKSTLMHVVITNLALWYSPDEVELYLVDFKKGVEFKAYATHELPHARVIAVESEREFGLSVLRRLDAELTTRGQLFRDLGVQDLAAYRRTAGPNHPTLPRVVFIVDEFQEYFVEDDKLAQEASLLLDRLVRQGRAFGMHVVLGSQTLGGAYSLARSTLGQMAIRIALQCSEADSYLIMSEDNNAPRLLSRPGEAIYNDASGMLEGNSPFQIVWLPEEKREEKLAQVHTRLEQSNITKRAPAIVFEGNIAADIERNHLLMQLLSADTVQSDQQAQVRTGPIQAWLGEAISIKDPTSMPFRRQSAANLLVVGQQEEAAVTMLCAMAISLAAHRKHQPRFVILDSTPADSPQYGMFESLSSRLASTPAIQPPGIPVFTAMRGVTDTIVAIANELAAREAGTSTDQSPIFMIAMGIHRYRDLRKRDDFSFGDEDNAPKPDKLLARIIREGPSFGIHTIAWCDTAANVDRTFERQTTREFEARVLFQMSANDSTALIDTPAAANLGRNRALLYREELGTVEKFRPYSSLSPEQVEKLTS